MADLMELVSNKNWLTLSVWKIHDSAKKKTLAALRYSGEMCAFFFTSMDGQRQLLCTSYPEKLVGLGRAIGDTSAVLEL